jgi:membrane protein required for colicin V production
MHPADGVILAIVAISVLFGVFRGFVREAFSLAGWVAAYVVARTFAAPAELFLADFIATPSLRLLAAWGGLFVVTLLLMALAGYMVQSLMEQAGAGGANRLLGGVFGFLRGLILVLAGLIFMAPYVSRDDWWQEAALPQQFMRHELLGRELKQKLVQAAKDAGSEVPAEDESARQR